jgi:cyanophycinase
VSGTLALVGGEEFAEGCSFDEGLLAASGGNEVVLLATAAAYERPELLIERAVAWFQPLGARVEAPPVYRRPDALVDAHVALVRSARFIYLAGGSPMHLRSVLKESPLFDALVAAWKGGAVVAGSSAGADVLCDPMVDPRGGAYTVGLGVIGDLAVIPRYDTWSHDKVHRTVELAPSGLSLVGIPSATALLRDPDGTWRAEGAAVDDVSVFIDGRPATPADLTA